MRLATYNVEWFANLFDDADQLVRDDARSGRRGVTRAQQADALGMVFQALDADAIMVIEAPNSGSKQDAKRALEGFAKHYGLRQSRAVAGFVSPTDQEIVLLYDPAKISVAHEPDWSTSVPPFDGSFDGVRFSKPPLELGMTAPLSLRLIGVHLKSKAPYGTETPQEAEQVARANRRKQIAQARWIGGRVADHLAVGESVVLMGDVNDDPGFDPLERDIGGSAADILSGAGLIMRPNPIPTARFGDGVKRQDVVLDYLMISPDLQAFDPVWRVWNPYLAPKGLKADLQKALKVASDHFPVTLDLRIPS